MKWVGGQGGEGRGLSLLSWILYTITSGPSSSIIFFNPPFPISHFPPDYYLHINCKLAQFPGFPLIGLNLIQEEGEVG
ncbi:hypothetical protein L6452_17601 [Arctium lappa]|uniref:Uncharacterized protein n=1 Tax=Arctium lappa TaxID=4217 RepID=A0ACB9C3Q1_ARCLA|nr:hypothetical protein L6452_17601 [Arctium lappa]